MASLVVVTGGIVMLLWNWLLPRLFGWPEITLLQGFGLLALCRILFGGFGGGAHWGALVFVAFAAGAEDGDELGVA